MRAALLLPPRAPGFRLHDLPPPEPVPPLNPDPQPNDPQPAVPPVEEERGPVAPVELPGQPGLPERACAPTF